MRIDDRGSAPAPARRFRLLGRWVSWCCASLVWTSVAAAQPAAPGREEARIHFERGLESLDRGDLHAAAQEFAIANAIVPSALAAYDAALAEARSGQPLSAVRLLRDAARLDAAPALRQKMDALLESERVKLGTLLLRVVDGQGADLAAVDIRAPGYAPGELRAAQWLEVTPGSLPLWVAADGYEPQRLTVSVPAGARVEVTVPLHAEATHSAVPSTAPPSVIPAPVPVRFPPERARVVAAPRAATRIDPGVAVVTCGVGAAVMAASGVVLWHADRAFADLSGEVRAFNASTRQGGDCSLGNNVVECQSRSASLNSRRAELTRERLFGAVGLGIGALTAGVGAVLYASSAHARRSAIRRGVAVTLSSTGAALLATGEF